MAEFERNNSEFSFEIVEHLAVLSSYNTGWKKEINIVSWNKANPKVDIRDWNPDHTQMSRGVTLTEAEAKIAAQAIAKHAVEKTAPDKMKESFER